jgi:hypothetical protein
MRMASWRWPHAVLVLSDRIPGDPLRWTPVPTWYGSGWGDGCTPSALDAM